MNPVAGSRLAAFGLLVAAAVGLWQALKLERWSFDGPSAGLFPQLVAGVCVVLCLIVMVTPGRPGGAAEANEPLTPETRRTLAIYVAAFFVLALGAMFAGFVVTALAVSILIVRFAEQRSWTAAIVCGLVCAIVGLVCFGWLLRVELPETGIERAFYSLVR